jgi:multidrug efflux pump subunit AcrB
MRSPAGLVVVVGAWVVGAAVAGGSVDTSADRINLRVTGAFSGVDAIAAVPVQANGQVFRLGDIATVKRGYEDPASFIVREGGKELALELEEKGYDWIKEAVASA